MDSSHTEAPGRHVGITRAALGVFSSYQETTASGESVEDVRDQAFGRLRGFAPYSFRVIGDLPEEWRLERRRRRVGNERLFARHADDEDAKCHGQAWGAACVTSQASELCIVAGSWPSDISRKSRSLVGAPDIRRERIVTRPAAYGDSPSH